MRSTVLLVEDDLRVAELVRHGLTTAEPGFEVEHMTRLSAALAVLARQPPTLIVTDLDLPDSLGPATVRHLQRAAPDLPVVVFSGDGSIKVVLECIREGADDFLVKGPLGFEALGRLVRLAAERRARPADRTTLESLGSHLLELAARTGLSAAVVFLKADRPPRGRMASSDTTGEVTSALQRAIRRCDVLARVDDDEWAVLMLMQQPDSAVAAEQRLAAMVTAMRAGSQVSVGAASYDPRGPSSIAELIAMARRDLHTVRTS